MALKKTTHRTLRRLSHHLFGMAYGLAAWVYRISKRVLHPLTHSHPRIHRFAVTLREAFRELLRPPEITRPPPVPEPLHEITPDPQEHPLERPPLPEWLLEEWREVHAIDPQLFPESGLAEIIPHYHVPTSRIAGPYLELCGLCGEGVSHLFLAPWLVRGGADLVTLNYVQSLITQGMAENILLITTLNADSPWKRRVPESVRVVEFGKRYDFLSPEEQERLLVRLLLQMAPGIIHNINSDLGYRIFAKYGKALASTSRLYVSSFCFDYTEQGRTVGYGVWYLSKCFDSLEAVWSDNQAHLNELQRMYAFDKEKLHVLYQPAPQIPGRRRFDSAPPNKDGLSILWAGRLDRQKRPDILIRIAQRCRDLPIRFHVYGSPVIDTDAYTGAFSNLENLTYHGGFDGLPSLPAEEYDLFLYTSEWDGLPNVLLEAISLRLPVIASDVGGISELIQHEKTGFLIAPYDDVDQFSDCLRKIAENPSVLGPISDNAYWLVSSRHSWEAFNGRITDLGEACACSCS